MVLCWKKAAKSTSEASLGALRELLSTLQWLAWRSTKFLNTQEKEAARLV